MTRCGTCVDILFGDGIFVLSHSNSSVASGFHRSFPKTHWMSEWVAPPKIIPRWELISDGGFERRESRGDHNVNGMAQRVVEDCTSFHQKLNRVLQRFFKHSCVGSLASHHTAVWTKFSWIGLSSCNCTGDKVHVAKREATGPSGPHSSWYWFPSALICHQEGFITKKVLGFFESSCFFGWHLATFSGIPSGYLTKPWEIAHL